MKLGSVEHQLKNLWPLTLCLFVRRGIKYAALITHSVAMVNRKDCNAVNFS